ncbi:murein tripeptide ABC transporter/oligopeptide ABC transporter ATP binding subunit OppF [Rhodovastum atsumiense]|uniref:ABC transporter ATP-binding protein n=1 Tax=Rhodovastum atsumiense TaxID=504468 RepID=A0A5M6ISY7_9PROT|nr:ABC transporter ATP-binding protein [Rhodovastum atsumiense]KAA5610555.1 ABC transporter ATP-binding protein [Rhodovastum atsumiense]CAH2604990.1 murein tripeptide ABC transporter/oligopeptide ABC transporter ATP binding subunit OppF [Rhodovastum atsumiense]
MPEGSLRAASGPVVLEAIEVSRSFDVSRPWLQRKLAREKRAVLRAVDDVSFAIPRGTTLSLVGESGCGKSTVARLSVGLYPPSGGEIRFEGQPLSAARAQPALRRRMNMIFQDPYASLNPRWRVRDIVAEPIRAFGLLRTRADIAARVGQLLMQVGLSPADGEKFPHEFSGGQRQRISIARALSSEPEFLVCDEPTSALDVSVQAQILNLMRDLQARLGLTYLFISHNLAVVRHVSDRLGVMYLGRIVEIGPVEAIFRTPHHPYTRMLLDAIPDLEMAGRARIPVGGEVPSPIDPPSGCPFHPRCPLANARCREEKPGHTRVQAPEGPVLAACHAVEEGRAQP